MNSRARPSSADFLFCGFAGHSCPVSVSSNSGEYFHQLATGKSPEPAGWKACATRRL